MPKILLLEDDHVLSKETAVFLHQKDFECVCVFDGETFFRQIRHETFDIYLLDINVPKMSGLDVCKQIRENNKTTPILMLTAYSDIQDKMDAFELGADDYLTKPFHLDELYIRIVALLRRGNSPQTSPDDLIIVSDLVINLSEQTVKRGEEAIELTRREYQL